MLVGTEGITVIYCMPELLLNKKQWHDILLSSTYCKLLHAFVVDEAHAVKK